MQVRYYYVTSIVLVVILALTVFYLIRWNEPYDPERHIKENWGPFISEYLGLSFPGQYASPTDRKNPRTKPYWLNDGEQNRAINKIQKTLMETEKIDVEIYDYIDGRNVATTYSMLYDRRHAETLCKRLDLAKRWRIEPFNAYGTVPSIVFILHPSEVKFNILSMDIPLAYFTQGKGRERLEGNFGDGFIETLMESRLQGGETVLEAYERHLGHESRLFRSRLESAAPKKEAKGTTSN